MCFKTLSKPTSGGMGGIRGRPFSKKSMGDLTGSNFEGANHLLKNQNGKSKSGNL